MKVAFKSIIGKRYHLISGSICAGAVLLVAFSAAAQNLFVASMGCSGTKEFGRRLI